MTFQFRFTVFSSSFQSHGCLTVLPSRPASLLSILRDELLGQGQPDYSKLQPACCNPTQAPAASKSADTTLQKTLSLTKRARENKTMQGDLKKYCVSLLPVWTIAETNLWQQRKAKTSESAAAVFLWSQTGSQGAACPRHRLPKAPPWRSHHHVRRRVRCHRCPSTAGTKQKAVRFVGHTLWLSVATYTLCSHQHRTSGFAAMTLFISAKQLSLQWQVKVPSCWERGLLGCLCRAAIKPGVSVCTYPLAPRGAALLLYPPLSSQTKILAAILETEVIHHPYRKLTEKYSSAHSHSSS